ncbi:lipid droplet assembly factor 1-A-like [Trichomycterus rosablanca]|uniref:lipid droplet assembly factor 1-A-like n=1 Tax=Trichomycterus rosablanca TaxID=2290929 RepID=UPI002F35A823
MNRSRENELLLPACALALQVYLTASMEGLKWDPKIAELLNTKPGRYLSNHPFITLVLLVFGVTASVPIGLFLVFAAVTLATVTIYFVFVEIFLLTIGGVTLLCVLCCLAVVSFWISCIFSILYTIISHLLNYSYHSQSEQTVSKEDIETEIHTPSKLTAS